MAEFIGVIGAQSSGGGEGEGGFGLYFFSSAILGNDCPTALGGFAFLGGGRFQAVVEHPLDAVFFYFLPIQLFVRHNALGVDALSGGLLAQQGMDLLVSGSSGLAWSGDNNHTLRLGGEGSEQEEQKGRPEFHKEKASRG